MKMGGSGAEPLLPIHLFDPVPFVRGGLGDNLSDLGEILIYVATYAAFYFSLYALPIPLPITETALRKHAKNLRDQKIARQILRKGTGDWTGEGHVEMAPEQPDPELKGKGKLDQTYLKKCEMERQKCKAFLISEASFEWKACAVAWVNSVVVCWIYYDYVLRESDYTVFSFANAGNLCPAEPSAHVMWLHKVIMGYFLYDWMAYSISSCVTKEG